MTSHSPLPVTASSSSNRTGSGASGQAEQQCAMRCRRQELQQHLFSGVDSEALRVVVNGRGKFLRCIKMSFFDGSTSKKKDVNLGGKSLKKCGAVVETKEQLAERNAQARLQREHQRVENSASLCISLAWRVRRARSIAKTRMQEVFEAAFNDCLHDASVLSPNDLGPPAQPILDRSVRALSSCFDLYMFLRHVGSIKLRSALHVQHLRLLDIVSSNLGAIFAFDGQSGAQTEVVAAILARVGKFELSRVLRAVGSDMLLSAVRLNSCPHVASALKLLSVPLWTCLNPVGVVDTPIISRVAHHASVAVLLCNTGAVAAQHSSGALLQLLVSSCVTCTHAVHTTARSLESQSADASNFIKMVVDAWRSQLLRVPSLLDLCRSVFHPQHAHSSHVWSELLQGILHSPAPVDSVTINNIMSISAVFKELQLTFRLVASLPGASHDVVTRDVVALFLHEICPESMSDLSTNAAAFTSWLKGLSQAQLDANQEMTRLLCNVIAPILRAASFPKALPILNLCAFESPVPALLLAQNAVFRSPVFGARILAATVEGSSDASASAVNQIYVMCKLWTHVLMIIDDSDLHEEHVPCEPAQLAHLASDIKSLLSSHFWRSVPGNSVASSCEAMKHAALALARSIFDRHARRPLTSDAHWMESATLSYVMTELPQAVPFDLRYKTFLTEVAGMKRANLDARPHVVHIRRGLLLEDGIRAFGDASERLRGPIKVMFVNDSGLPEAGIDAGGVFKEFLSSLVERAFDSNLGLFLRNPAGQLYPNPESSAMVPNDSELFEFVGSVLGKAVFEGIQVDIPLAPFFIGKLLGRKNYFDELHGLDPQLHKSLLQIKKYKGDVQDLCLDFTVAAGEITGNTPIELFPGGASVNVTNSNRHQYVHLVADHKLNQQIAKQCRNFILGFSKVVPKELLRVFNPEEMQTVISGKNSGDWDVEDLAAHAKYEGCTASSSTVVKLMKVLREFTPQQRSLFLKFVTSCPRPPLLGFCELQPPLCIYLIPSERGFFSFGDEDRLPTASTCFNLLKLPPYKSSKVLREKLLYAITSGSGFELS